jgi:negative regulator of replication initiation
MAKMKQIMIDVEVNGIIEANRTSFSERENDILRRLLLKTQVVPAKRKPQTPMVAATEVQTAQFGSRTMGQWQVKFGEVVLPASSLKEAYCNLLLIAHRSDTHFLERYSKLQSKARRYVARSGPSLYLNSPHLAKDHAAPLADGWFVDTNLSEGQVHMRVRSATKEAGLVYGRDVWIKQGDRLI